MIHTACIGGVLQKRVASYNDSSKHCSTIHLAAVSDQAVCCGTVSGQLRQQLWWGVRL